MRSTAGDPPTAQPRHGLAEPGRLAHPAHVLGASDRVAGLDDQPGLERLDHLVELVDVDPAREDVVDRPRNSRSTTRSSGISSRIDSSSILPAVEAISAGEVADARRGRSSRQAGRRA